MSFDSYFADPMYLVRHLRPRGVKTDLLIFHLLSEDL